MRKLIIISILAISIISAKSDKAEAGEQSDLSKMLKSSGSLLVKESHSLPKLKTTYGNDIEASIFVLKNLLADNK